MSGQNNTQIGITVPIDMTHDELLAKLLVTDKTNMNLEVIKWQLALYAVVELHKPETHDPETVGLYCDHCSYAITEPYPCPTIQAIEKELK